MAPILAAALFAPLSPARGAPESLSVSADTPLRFGAFVVISSGSRTVSASGTVTNVAIFPIASAPVGPAQFTVTYDRGNNSQRPLNIVFDVMLGQVSPVSQSGVTGVLSAFGSDLAGAAALVPGQVYTYTMANCVTRICSRSFRIGARIDVTRASGGAALTIQLPVIANLISSDKL